MKKIKFFKMNGAGNDFIMIDNYKGNIELNKTIIEKLCRRRYSIGADGLIVLEKSKDKKYDFLMRYYNSDGKEAEMCGNGGRCISYFAYMLKYSNKKMLFLAKDGEHYAEIKNNGNVKLKMIEPFNYKKNISIKIDNKNIKGDFINTGVPHFVVLVKNIEKINVFDLGRKIRFSKEFSPEGTNVNFIQHIEKNKFKIRTYERGVEEETLACGTGAVASGVIMFLKNKSNSPIELIARGGKLKVYFKEKNGKIYNVFLEGDAKVAYKGEILKDALK